jgi:ABC-type branched-subunit amino acid transport system ATPase component
MNAAIEVSNLAKIFGGLRAVDGVTLQVAPGERRALIGPNGAGKTTLFHCVTGTLLASSGRVRLFGFDVTQLPDYRRTELGMGRTFQITNVFTELSLVENLVLSIIGTGRFLRSRPSASRHSPGSKLWAWPTAPTNRSSCCPMGNGANSSSRWR